MSKPTTKSKNSYIVRMNGEVQSTFETLRAARIFVKKTYNLVEIDKTKTVVIDIIKQYTTEIVMNVYEPKPVQFVIASDLDKDLYK